MLPKEHSFQPEPQQLERLIDGLYENNWLCRPGSEDFSKLDFSLRGGNDSRKNRVLEKLAMELESSGSDTKIKVTLLR